MTTDPEYLDTVEYTITDVIEEEPLEILRLWKFTIRDGKEGDIREATVEVFLSHDVSAAYEENLNTDGGSVVGIEQVPEGVCEKLIERLERDIEQIRKGKQNIVEAMANEDE